MKKKVTFILAIMIAMIVGAGCKSKKPIQKSEGSTEIRIPFEGKEYQNDKDHFRAKQVGKSPDMAAAKKIALQNAKSELAGNIQSLVKRVTDQYTNQRSISNKQEYENKFEEEAREVVKQALVEVKVIGEKMFQQADGSYSYWVAVEASKEAIYNGIDAKISANDMLLLEYDKARYKKIFDEEMEKLENGQ